MQRPAGHRQVGPGNATHLTSVRWIGLRCRGHDGSTRARPRPGRPAPDRDEVGPVIETWSVVTAPGSGLPFSRTHQRKQRGMTDPSAGGEQAHGVRLSRALVELADTLVTTFDIDDYLHTLCGHAHDLLEGHAAGVLLEGPDGDLQLSASTEDSAAIDLFERQAQEGPCFDAYRTGEQIVDLDLTTVEDRWPNFVPWRWNVACDRSTRSRCDCVTSASGP